MENIKRYIDVAKEMKLLHISEHSPGVVFWHPKGFKLLEKLKQIVAKHHEVHGYEQVKSPNIVGQSLFEKSGHLEKFAHNMFLSDSYAIRPMSCPNHIDIYQQGVKSYQDLPYALFEFGEVCRNEENGALQALFRMRAFCQDDSHVFVKHEDILSQVSIYLKMAKEIYADFGFNELNIFVSLRPEKRFGDDDLWDKAEQYLFDACNNNNMSFEKIEGGGAFYGPKIELHIKDSLNRSWQMGVIQLDFVLPGRFDLSYVNSDNKKEVPAILHHAVLGSLERFIGILLENYLSHKNFPMSIAPDPVVIIPISVNQMEYAKQVEKQLKIDGVACRVMDKDMPLKMKIAAAKSEHVPILIVIGEREQNSNCVSFQNKAEKENVALSELGERLKSLGL